MERTETTTTTRALHADGMEAADRTMTFEWFAAATRGRWRLEPGQPRGRVAGVSIDSREMLAGRAFLAIRGERHDGHDHLDAAVRAGAALVVVESALPRSRSEDLGVPVLEVPDPRRALADLARAWRRSLEGTRVVAVTGSCGKTTTRRLIEAALRGRLRGHASPKSYNNEIGVPLSILATPADAEFLLLEIGTNGPGEIGLLAGIAAPHVGVITMVGRAHLEGLGSLEAIAAEKASLLDRLAPPAVAVVAADGGILESAVAARSSRLGEVITVGTAPHATLRMVARHPLADGGQEVELADGRRFRLRLCGAHNACNALAALAVALRMGVPFESAAAGIAAVLPEDRRLVIRPLDRGRTLVDDAYNANPDSMAAALSTLAEVAGGTRPCVLVLGEMLELGAASAGLHADLGRSVVALAAQQPIAEVIWVGGGVAPGAEATRAGGLSTRTLPQASRDLGESLAATLPENGVLLLKGSRGIGLDRLVEWLPVAR
jgi:UDP-N-acetylmuramoyl-tripeptide--D-alanyl-D-alanine ligase